MGRRHEKRKARARSKKAGSLTVDRRARSGHYQGRFHSDVYRDGKAYVYTAWNDNEDVVGTPMRFEEWVEAYEG